MSVYVDDMVAAYRGMKMCHMIADTRAELLAMADKVGVQRKWLQAQDTHKEHFDICLSKRALAVAAGAVEVPMRQLAMMISERLERSMSNPEIVCNYKTAETGETLLKPK